jgi:hypothetical protein
MRGGLEMPPCSENFSGQVYQAHAKNSSYANPFDHEKGEIATKGVKWRDTLALFVVAFRGFRSPMPCRIMENSGCV